MTMYPYKRTSRAPYGQPSYSDVYPDSTPQSEKVCSPRTKHTANSSPGLAYVDTSQLCRTLAVDAFKSNARADHIDPLSSAVDAAATRRDAYLHRKGGAYH
jgi:hypothetical protein